MLKSNRSILTYFNTLTFLNFFAIITVPYQECLINMQMFSFCARHLLPLEYLYKKINVINTFEHLTNLVNFEHLVILSNFEHLNT